MEPQSAVNRSAPAPSERVSRRERGFKRKPDCPPPDTSLHRQDRNRASGAQHSHHEGRKSVVPDAGQTLPHYPGHPGGQCDLGGRTTALNGVERHRPVPGRPSRRASMLPSAGRKLLQRLTVTREGQEPTHFQPGEVAAPTLTAIPVPSPDPPRQPVHCRSWNWVGITLTRTRPRLQRGGLGAAHGSRGLISKTRRGTAIVSLELVMPPGKATAQHRPCGMQTQLDARDGGRQWGRPAQEPRPPPRSRTAPPRPPRAPCTRNAGTPQGQGSAWGRAAILLVDCGSSPAAGLSH